MAETVDGLKQLNKQLATLGAKTHARALRRSVMQATKPALQQMKARVPVGSKPHITYRKLLVSPGFLKRSIVRRSKVDRRKGAASAVIGVKDQAYYGIVLLDQGPYRVTTRRRGGGGRGTSIKRPIKPYTIHARPWFQSVFIANRHAMEQALKTELEKAVEAARRG